ncbi:Phosphofructokinase family protein [Histomonas meleagridis]|uniref:Phosphofructokinase family protein n=1 Tax=Histomonas meleagridis TaxID=135588 RepID=UPI00355A52FF|nr:Phosphofructokinase family protein [Histomonas meleagridis]KAH0800430.1 Phosphofructokinase family protein [Histomonas meleagridis]
MFAVVSSGTDNSGINGAIRAIVRTAAAHNAHITGIRWGFQGLLQNQMSILTSRDVSGKIGKAGCFLGTAKLQGILTNQEMDKAIKVLKKKKITGLIVIGGLHSLKESRKFINHGIQVIGIPSTIQDDINGTDISLGVDSAVNNVMKCVDRIRGSSSSRERTFLVQVEGRECGMLAVRSSLVTGADFCMIPERPCSDMSRLSQRMAEFSMRGKNQCITIVSSGWKPGIDSLEEYLSEHEKDTDLLVRKTVLGYVQRGGAPTGYDRILGTEMGHLSVIELLQGQTGKMIATKNNKIVSVPLDEIDKKREINPELLATFKLTR